MNKKQIIEGEIKEKIFNKIIELKSKHIEFYTEEKLKEMNKISD